MRANRRETRAMANRVARWTNYEPFTFKDGIRWAWVTYEAEMPIGERRAVKVSEVSLEDAQ